jgi:hypothetical protein
MAGLDASELAQIMLSHFTTPKRSLSEPVVDPRFDEATNQLAKALFEAVAVAIAANNTRLNEQAQSNNFPSGTGGLS